MSSVDLTNELRLAKPRAPEQLRERISALSERPVREPRFSFSLPSGYTVRRFALVAVPAIVALGVGGAAIHGIASPGASAHEAVRSDQGEIASKEHIPAPSTTTPTNTVQTYDSAQV